MKKIQVAIIEDDKNLNASLCKAIDIQVMMETVFTAFSVEEGLKQIQSGKAPTVMLLDIGLPGMSGLEGIPKFKELMPSLDIIMLTTYEENDKIFTALCSGACSYLSKKTSLKEILEAIHTVSRGGSSMSPSIARKIVSHFNAQKNPRQKVKEKLTEKQYKIMESLSDGMSYGKIAEKHFISINTVRHHIKNIYEILEVNSKSQLFKLLK